MIESTGRDGDASVVRRVIRMFPDYGHEWPLWEDAHDEYVMEPSDYNLSADFEPGMTSGKEDSIRSPIRRGGSRAAGESGPSTARNWPERFEKKLVVLQMSSTPASRTER